MYLIISPVKSMFQIARRRKIIRIFTTNVFNIVRKLLTSDTLVLSSHAETHLVASESPNVHLAKEWVRARSKYIWPVPLWHPSQWRYQSWIKDNVSLISMSRFYCELVKLLSICIWFMSENFFILYVRILKILISFFIRQSKGWH